MGGDEAADLLVIYAIADRLGKFAHEVLAMPSAEVDGWLAYIGRENDRLKQARNGR